MAVHPFVHAQDLSERGDSLRPSIALKTNVLYDMVLTPNFEIEKDLGRHLSLDVETAFPWYTWHRNLRCYEVFEAGGELRWWTGHFATTRQRRLTGFFLGLYGAGGYYDLEWDGRTPRRILVDWPLLGFLKTYSTPLEPRALRLPRLRRRTVQEL